MVTILSSRHYGDRVVNSQRHRLLSSDGFGLRQHKGSLVKIPTNGYCLCRDDCEIAANTCIDRGALDNRLLAKRCH